MSDETGDPMGGYPQSAKRRLELAAKYRYADKTGKYGPGVNWLDDAPGYHIEQIDRRMDEAVYRTVEGDAHGAMTALGDTYNHLLFVHDILEHQNEDLSRTTICPGVVGDE